jgi:methenyltetrahydrofolate cyclohydrolase
MALKAPGGRQVEAWLDALASSSPTPGGGGAAALSAAMGASLVSMVCNLTIGKRKYEQFEAQMRAALAEAAQMRAECLDLADADALAFDQVMESFKLPRSTEAEVVARSEAIQSATRTAAMVPLKVARVSARLVNLCNEILEGANKNVISDVAVAASTARAALESSRVNVEVNLATMANSERRKAIQRELEDHVGALGLATDVIETVRKRLET